MPSEVLNNISAASGAVASSQLPNIQNRTTDAASSGSNTPDQNRAAAAASATQAQAEQRRTIQRETKRSEGSFPGQERPKDDRSEGDTPNSTDSGQIRKQNSTKLNRVA